MDSITIFNISVEREHKDLEKDKKDKERDKDKEKEKEKDKDKEKERKKLPDLDKYWRVVKDDASDFTGWTYLLQYVDSEVINLTKKLLTSFTK